MPDLFTSPGRWMPLALPDAEIALLRTFSLPDNAFDVLLAESPWRQDDIVIFGKRMQQPRLHAWYGDPGATYTYSGLRNEPLPWTHILTKIRRRVTDACGVGFNSVLLNLYRDQNDSMGMHADDELELGAEPVVASLSLGATRRFVLKHRTRRDLKAIRIDLEEGDLLLMRGATQAHWKHGLPKCSTSCGPRLNLTFRHIRY